MSRIPILAATLFVLSLGAPSGPMGDAAAQTTPEDSLREPLRRELEHLLSLRAELAIRAQRADSIRREARRAAHTASLDTFDLGPFRLAAEPSQRDFVQGIFEDAWAEAGTAFRGSEDLLEARTFVVRIGPHAREQAAGTSDDSTVEVVSVSGLPKEAYRGMAFSAVATALGERLPEEVLEWVGPEPLLRKETLPWTARELVTAPSTVARRCYRGELDACRSVLGLVPNDEGWAGWYTPDERRRLVEKGPRPDFDSRAAALWDQCVDLGVPGACDLLLGDRRPTPPLGESNRAALVTVALRMGGEGAAHRLLAPGTIPVEDRLARVAGVTPDSLIAAWRSELLEAEPSAWAGLGRTPAAAAVWLLLFAFLAARSTRWRLG